MKKKIKLKKIISLIVLFVSLCTLIYSSYKILIWQKNNNDNKKIKKKTEQSIEVDNNTNQITVDFETLKSQNQDIIAYLKVKGTNIDYVVTKSSNNKYYLNHNLNHEYNESGWVFADYRNKFDETDKNIIIYAHNTMDGSMFGSLKNALNRAWYTNEENYNITLITQKQKYTYRVFSVYQIEAEDYYIQTDFTPETFEPFVKTIKERSIYDFKTEVNSEDKIITLSTCSQTGNDRVVVHAKMIS